MALFHRPAGEAMNIAIIDLGTNSVRFDVYNFSNPSKPKLLHEERHMIRLGEDLFKTKKISPKATQKAKKAFRHFRSLMQSFHVHGVRAVATESVRFAKNKKKFIHDIESLLGFPLEILSKNDEATLIAKGILSNEKIRHPTLLIDIGGGSTELSLVQKNKKVLQSVSIPLGAAKIQQLFLKTHPPKLEDIHLFQAYAQNTLTQTFPKKTMKVTHALASSGTAKGLDKLLKTPFKRALSLSSMAQFNLTLSSLTKPHIKKVRNMESKRADLILAGSLWLEEILRFFHLTSFEFTPFSLRHGLLQKEIERRTHPAQTLIVGDVHGCYDELKKLLKKAQFDPQEDRLIFVGDLINKGPKAFETLQLVKAHHAEVVMGNHELLFLQKYKSKSLPAPLKKLKKALGQNLDQTLHWMRSFPKVIESKDFTVVHAGKHPQKPLAQTPVQILANIRTWKKNIRSLQNEQHLPWYDFYKQKKIIVFGHWAKKGLVKRRNVIGLDTGCVYGKKLTLLKLPGRKIIQVEAQKVYKRIKPTLKN